jgi:hypothetical protein
MGKTKNLKKKERKISTQNGAESSLEQALFLLQ